MDNERPHLSPSQITMYLRCGEQYHRRYIEGETVPPGISLIHGKSAHKAAETNFRQKLESHADLPADEIAELAAAEFETQAAGEVLLTDEENARGIGVVLGEAKDRTVAAAKFHAEKQAPDYQPAIVEEKVRINLPAADRDLLGIIDLADDKGRVVDFKFASKSKPAMEAETSPQLTIYAAAYRHKTGRDPSEVRLDTVVQGSRDTKRQVLTTDRGMADFVAMSNTINSVLAGIAAGVFNPAMPGSWVCSDRFCGYWRTCPYVNSERKALTNE